MLGVHGELGGLPDSQAAALEAGTEGQDLEHNRASGNRRPLEGSYNMEVHCTENDLRQ